MNHRSAARDTPRGCGSTGPRLQTQLLLFLLLFGAVPVAVVATFGYSVSRQAIIAQAETALQELARRQVSYLQTEVRRERLILRTIAGQIGPVMGSGDDIDLNVLLSGGLANDGVFDGLRVVEGDGRTIADVALRETDPHWPDETQWPIPPGPSLHLDSDSVVAYLLAVPLSTSPSNRWLQGHVRSEDFSRNLDIPRHVLGGVELAVFDSLAHTIVVSHGHAELELRNLLLAVEPARDNAIRTQLEGHSALGFTTPLPELSWTMVAALPLSIVLAPVNRLVLITFIGSTVLVLILFAAAHLASRHITTPLRELSNAASTFGETGSYETIEHRGVGETRALIESFQAMVNRLRQTRSEVEQLHELEMERAQQLATVGELASGVAHEIRNPLTGVIGALEVIRRKIGNGDTMPLLDEARAQLHRIESTTSRLLEYARPPDLRLSVVDVAGVVERAVRVVQSNADKAGVRLCSELGDDALTVNIDPELVVQVLVNLLLNGIEATPERGTLEIQAAQAGKMVEIKIIDRGSGVASENRHNVFRPFFTTKHRGTGLGLSISQQIAVRHGGGIQYDDTPGGGATFVLTLPRLPAEVVDD